MKNSYILKTILLLISSNAFASDWVYQSDDFSASFKQSQLSVVDTVPLPDVQLGMVEYSDDIYFSSLMNAAIVNSGSTYFLSDDEVIVMNGDDSHSLILPSMNTSMRETYKQSPDFKVISNNMKQRSIVENRRYILATDFIKPGTTGYLSSEDPALIFTQHRLGNINLRVTRKYKNTKTISLSIHQSDLDFMDTAKLNKFMKRGIDELLMSNAVLIDLEDRVTMVQEDGVIRLKVDLNGTGNEGYLFEIKEKH